MTRQKLWAISRGCMRKLYIGEVRYIGRNSMRKLYIGEVRYIGRNK